MAHFALLWKARTIEKYRQNYENEKINSIIMSSSDVPDKTLFQRWRHYKHGMQKRLSRKFSKWYPEGSTVSNFFVGLKADRKLPSILFRSLSGFIGGLLLTYLGFMFFVFQLSLSLMYATVLCSILGVLLTLGLTFSNRTRCLIFLLVPQLFSRVGRYTLTCYALVLILTGPATNTLKNSEVLSESMACTQEQIKLDVKQIDESIKKPFNTIKDSLKVTVKRMNLVVKKLKIALIKINKLILSIASTIQSGYSWLRDMADSCNNDLGNPYDKCSHIIKEYYEKSNQNYDSNDMSKHVKHNRQLIKDILYAIGIKNLKRRQGYSDGKDFKRNTDTDMDNNVELKNFKEKKEDNDFNIDNTQSPNTEDKGDGDTTSSTYKADDLSFSDINNTAQKACKSFKSYEKFCVPADFTSDTFFATIRTSLKKFVHRFSTLIHLKLNVQHTYTFIGNSSSSNQIAAGIVTEVRNRADPLLTWLSWSSCVTSLFLLLIIFRAKHYQHMFETRSRFDNRFITKEFRELDLKRLREGRETVLPLNTRERAKYVTTTSFRLVASEKLHLNRSAVFMTVATFKLLIHIVADYSLFWVLTTIRHYGKLPSPLKPPSVENGSTISGSGFVSRFLQALIDTMNAQLTFPPHNRSCLPDPYPPDIKRYCQIGFLIFLLWFFALFEPYGLRLRHLIMGRYRPQRAKDRAAWLYNHILRTRARFMKFARRKLHREYKYSSHTKYTLRQCFKNHVLLQWLTSLFGIKLDGPRCLLCNLAEDTSNVNTEIVKCEVPNCPGSYCLPCFSDIGQLCTICLSPSDYGDFSDVSFEKDTSDENENTDDEHTTDDDYDPGDGPSGSYKRKSNSEYYALEDGDSEDDTFSRRSLFSEERRKRLLFGRENTDSDTIPLLQRQGNGFNENHKTPTSQSYFYEPIITKFAVINYDKIRLYPKTVKVSNDKQTQSNYVISNYLQNIDVQENNSSIGIVQFSLYEITSHPLNVKKSEYTTKFAKYLRKKKLVRQKRSIYNYSPYFMTCNNNNNNVNNETTKDKRKKRIHKKESKKPKKDGTNNNLNNEFKSFHKTHDLKNERKSKRRSKKNSEIKSPFSKFWKSVTCNVLQIKSTNDTKTSPPIGENHAKRKKKRKKTKKLAKKSTKSMLNIKKGLAENSRLFAFLYGRDWINNCYDDNKNFHSADEEIAINNRVIANRKIIVNDVVIPKLNLSVSVESIKDPLMQKIDQCRTVMSKKKISNHAFEKFVKSIGCFSHESIGSIGSNKEINNDNLDLDEFDAADDLCQDVQNHEQKTNGGSKSSELQGSSRVQNSPTDFNIGASPKRNVSPEEVRSQNSSISTSLSNLKKRCSALLFRKDKKKSLNETAITERLEATQLNVDPVHKKIVQYNANNQKRIGLSLRCGRFVEDIFHNAAFDKRGNKGIQTTPEGIQTDDKETTVLPLMNTFACQNLILNDTQEFGAQVRIRKCHRRKTFKNARISTCLSTCTCATQYHDTVHKDIGTSMTPVLQHKQIQKTITSPTTTETTISGDYGSHSDTTVCSYEKMYNKAIYQLEKLTNRVGRNDQEVKYRYDNCTSFSKKFGKFRLRVVTKTNRSTLTDRTTQRDASTAMYDWWSPIVERKEVVTKRPVEKRRKDMGQPRLRERRSYRSKGMSTGEKIVAFRSKTQFIPSIDYSCSDVMSPSRYILESQRYYNEVFSNVFPSPRVYPVPCLQKNNNLDRDRSKLSNAQHRRRGRKAKRLDESYTPRKDLQSCLRRRY